MALDLIKNVETILEAAKTATLEEVKAALETEQAKPEPERRSTLVTGLQKIVDAADEQKPDEQTQLPPEQPQTPPKGGQVTKTENPALKGLKSVSVRVNPDKNLAGAAFYDPDQKVTIRAESVTVKRTRFIQQKLANEELVED